MEGGYRSISVTQRSVGTRAYPLLLCSLRNVGYYTQGNKNLGDGYNSFEGNIRDYGRLQIANSLKR